MTSPHSPQFTTSLSSDLMVPYKKNHGGDENEDEV